MKLSIMAGMPRRTVMRLAVGMYKVGIVGVTVVHAHCVQRQVPCGR